MMRQRISVGVAIGVDSVTASWRAHREAEEWSVSLTDDGHGAPSAEILRVAFADLQSRLPAAARTTLSIAILPPLAGVRRIQLPRMTDEDRRLAVSRSIDRHLVGLTEAVVSIERRQSRSLDVPFLAAAVPSAFIRDLEFVTHEFGWAIDRFVPAQAAWARAGMSQWCALRRGDARVVVAGTRETTILIMQDGALTATRRVRVGAVAPLDAPVSRSFVLGDGSRSPALIAAGAARGTQSLHLVPDAVRGARREAQVRATRWFLCVAASCVVAAGGVYRWGLSRHIDVIAMQRNALRSRVSKAVAARDTLDHLLRSIDAIQSLERAAPRWSSAIARIALALPQNASLTTLRVDGDSVRLDGQAGDAASVFAALRSAPGIVDVRSTAPIRHELALGEHSIERWTIALRVAPTIAAPGDK